MDAPIDYATSGKVARITINRPAVLNAMNAQTHELLSTAFNRFQSDRTLQIAVLAGAGGRALSVGADLHETSDTNLRPMSSLGSFGKPGHPRFTDRFDITKPVIARVEGYAYGGGFELALACDIVLCAQSATFRLPETRIGLIPGAGGIFRLLRSMPRQEAMGMLIAGKVLTAARALELGIVNEVVPTDQLEDCVERWVEEILAASPSAVRAVKEIGILADGLPLKESFLLTSPAEEARLASNESEEGVAAFRENRAPRW